MQCQRDDISTFTDVMDGTKKHNKLGQAILGCLEKAGVTLNPK